VRLRFGARQGLRQKNPAAQAREAKPVLRAEHFQKQMIPRVPARGKAELKMFQRKPAGYMEDLPPRPAPEIVLRLKAVHGAVKATTFTSGHRRGCKSSAKGLASSVTSKCSAAARKTAWQ